MSPMPLRRRRRLLALLAGTGLAPWPARADPAAWDGPPDPVRRGRPMVLPRDHGAHPHQAIEWWYATGWLGTPERPSHGWQITFFRSRTGLAADDGGRFAPRQLLFAHLALTELAGAGAPRHRHAERLARWNGDPAAVPAAAALHDARIHIGDWTLRREPSSGDWRAELAADGYALALQLSPTQPTLLQGEAGFSRKGPLPGQASHYLTEPQLAVRARLRVDGRVLESQGRGWLDHEWADALLPAGSPGWDWCGINLFDGGALTAFRLRDGQGAALWAGGSWRAGGGAPVAGFGPEGVDWTPLRRWRSPATGAVYPVEWALRTPAGAWRLRALLDAQELDARASTGTVYWEGLCELLDGGGRRVGLGYLEMTGYAGALRL